MITRREANRVIFVSMILAVSSTSLIAQVNPFIYFRITKCDNCKVTAYVNETVIMKDGCEGKLAWNPVLLNSKLEQKNKLRFELKNEAQGEFHGSIVFELLKADPATGVVKRFFQNEIKLEDHDRFQVGIDNLLKKQDWNYTYPNAPEEPFQLISQRNRKDSLDFFFTKKHRYYVTVTAAKHSAYKIAINEQRVLGGELHISNLADAYALADYPSFFLNTLDTSVEEVVMNYTLQPREDGREAYLEIMVQHFPPGYNEPGMVSISKITCPKGDIKNGRVDLTEPLKRSGFFIR